MKERSDSSKVAISTEVGREAYEAYVMQRMKGRSGAYTPKGASGNAFEILANDKENMRNILKTDTVTRLTKSPVAPQVDAVTMKNGKVLERIQYKDTPSVSGIQKTLNQVESGKYKQVQLRGTTETTEKFNILAEKRGISKRMESTGISSKTTNRIGDKFTGQTPKITNVKNVAKNSALTAAGVTAGIEIIKSIENGDSVGECTGHVVSKSTESAITAATSAVAAEVAFGVTSSLVVGSCIPVIAAGAVAIGAGAVVGEVTDGIFDDIGDEIGYVVDDIGDTISDVADDIGNAISDACFEIGCFFDGLFL